MIQKFELNQHQKNDLDMKVTFTKIWDVLNIKSKSGLIIYVDLVLLDKNISFNAIESGLIIYVDLVLLDKKCKF